MTEKPKYSYAVSPHEVYVTRDANDPSIATLDIGVANREPDDLACRQIAFEVVDLTDDPGRIAVSASKPQKWEIAPIESAPGQFRAVPVPPNEGVAAGDSVSFRLSNIVVDGEPGLAKVRVVEVLEEHRGETALDVSKIRGDLEIVYFQPRPAEVAPGDTSTLVWESRGAASAEITWPGGRYEIPAEEIGKGSYDVAPASFTLYTLRVAGGTGPDRSEQAAVSVRRLSIVEFLASAHTIPFGDEIELTWKTVFATRCELEPNPGKLPIDVDGSVKVEPETTTTYTLNAYGDDGQRASEQQTVTVNPRIVAFLAPESGTRSYRYTGEPVRLEWEVEGALERILTSDRRATPIELDAKGSVELPYLGFETEVFTLTCRSQGGLSVSAVTKTWQDPGRGLITSMEAEPSSLAPGESTTIRVTLIEYGDYPDQLRLFINTYPSPGDPRGEWSEVLIEEGERPPGHHELIFSHTQRQDRTTCYVAIYSTIPWGWQEERQQLIVPVE